MTPGRIVLTGTSDGISGRTWQSHGPVRVGRLTEAELVLDHGSVSRQHAEITCDGRGWTVADRGSTNGTFVNGMRVARSGQPVKAGDILQFGHLIVQVTEAHAGGRESLLLAADRMQLKAMVTRTGEDAVGPLRACPAGVSEARAAPPDRRLAIRDIGRDFFDVRSLDSYLDGILWSAADALGAQYGAVLTWGPGAGRPDLRAQLACGPEIAREVWLKSRPVHAAMVSCQSQLYVDPRINAGDAAYPRNGSPTARDGTPGALICAVLRSPRRSLGLLCLARSTDRKPFDQDDLFLADDLALAVSPTVESLDRLIADKRTLLLKTLTALAQTIELRDATMSNHCQRVTDYALMLADELKIPRSDRLLLEAGTPLHDLGKIGVSDAVLQRGGSLTDVELDQLKSYPLKGAALVEAVPGLEDFLPIVRNHRERWDGRGYPDGLAGAQIPLIARVVGLADAFDAMTTDRPYNPALSLDEAFAELERTSGSQFDPNCVAAFLRLRPRLEETVRQRELCSQTMHRDELRRTQQSIVLNV